MHTYHPCSKVICTPCVWDRNRRQHFLYHWSFYPGEEHYFGKSTIAYFISQKRFLCQGGSNIPVLFTLRRNMEQLHRNLWSPSGFIPLQLRSDPETVAAPDANYCPNTAPSAKQTFSRSFLHISHC